MQLLKDDARRTELANLCQSTIDKGHRFKHRIDTLAEILQLNLRPGGNGNFQFLQPDLFKKTGDDYLSSLTFNSPAVEENDSILLQIFQSSGLAFDPKDSQSAHLPADRHGAIQHNFSLTDSRPFMRLDVGEYFSTHSHVELRVTPTKQAPGQDRQAKVIDLNRDVIASNQFLWNGQTLACGFDFIAYLRIRLLVAMSWCHSIAPFNRGFDYDQRSRSNPRKNSTAPFQQ